jgi:isopentenyl-diphosphate delta-isomerase
MPEDLILVDTCNRAIGRAEKWRVHEKGLLHRAFSIFLVDERGGMLLQQRNQAKYHSGGLWANSCCGHPRPGERTLEAARRRLHEELGATAQLRFGFRARYCTSLPNGLTENEIVYVYFGSAPDSIAANPAEVSATAWLGLTELKRDILSRPRRYAYWLRYYFKNHFAAIRREVNATRGRDRKKASR